jgi:hypothetical protein
VWVKESSWVSKWERLVWQDGLTHNNQYHWVFCHDTLLLKCFSPLRCFQYGRILAPQSFCFAITDWGFFFALTDGRFFFATFKATLLIHAYVDLSCHDSLIDATDLPHTDDLEERIHQYSSIPQAIQLPSSAKLLLQCSCSDCIFLSQWVPLLGHQWKCKSYQGNYLPAQFSHVVLEKQCAKIPNGIIDNTMKRWRLI